MIRKVIVVIVEGKSDKILMNDRLEEYFDECSVNFEIVRSDIFSNSKPTNIESNIRKQINSLKSRKKFTSKDILCVIHITDMDGCFIDDSFISIDDEQTETTIYTEENIVVKNEKQKDNISSRNFRKRESTEFIIKNEQLRLGNIDVNYQLFYFSRNLEHVLFGNPNPDKETKVSEVNSFLESLDEDLERWLVNYYPEIIAVDYSEKYKFSWDHIRTGINSLTRKTNVPLIFEYIEALFDVNE